MAKTLNVNRFKKSAAAARQPKLSPAPQAADSAEPPSQRRKAALTHGARCSKRRAEILRNVDELPSLPAVVTEVMRIAGNPETNAKDFEEPFRKDQVLTAKLLKLVNSSFYGLTSKISTVHHATVILGFKTIKSLAMACSTSAMLARPVIIYGYTQHGLWEHSIATASIARYLGLHFLKLHPDEAEELFVAGLLHDIGKIAMVGQMQKLIPTIEQIILKKSDITLTQLEQHLLGIDHTEVGSMMMRKWHLDENLISAVGEHHREHYSSQRAALISLADLMAMRTKIGLADSYNWQRPIGTHLKSTLQLSKERLDELKPLLRETVHESLDVFGNLHGD